MPKKLESIGIENKKALWTHSWSGILYIGKQCDDCKAKAGWTGMGRLFWQGRLCPREGKNVPRMPRGGSWYAIPWPCWWMLAKNVHQYVHTYSKGTLAPCMKNSIMYIHPYLHGSSHVAMSQLLRRSALPERRAPGGQNRTSNPPLSARKRPIRHPKVYLRYSVRRTWIKEQGDPCWPLVGRLLATRTGVSCELQRRGNSLLQRQSSSEPITPVM